jgi:hypothetical protein
MAWLGITVHSGARVEDLARRITRCRASTYLAICAGRFDVLAEVVCVGPGELTKLIDDEIRPVKEPASVRRSSASTCTTGRCGPRTDRAAPAAAVTLLRGR